MRKTAASLLSAALAATATAACAQSAAQPELGVRSAPVIVVDGLRFKDLDRNGKLDPYEDWRLTPQARARDLTARMTLEEKAGAMMHGTAPAVGNPLGMGSAYDAAAATAAIGGRGVNSMITRLSAPPAQFAEQNNALQAIAEATRLGVPLTLSTDPRNHIQHMVGVGVDAAGFSIWPDPTGLAAIGDPALTRRFGDIARREYRAVGIHEALSPQADLATEPRWPRVSGTFGEDADLAGKLVQAYIEGFQNGGGGIGKDSVLTVVKHWAGYGASRDGFDGHTYYGRYAFPGGAFAYHLKPFEGAFAAKVAGVMPTYDIIEGVSVDGAPLEPVAAGFSRQMLTGLLRGRYGFEGVILSDWAITNDCNERCRTGKPEQRPQDIGMPWGVEDASVVDRFAKGVVAGLDQFGGVDDPAPLLAAVREGKVPAARLDDSVRRIMEQKFAQGLFENPYVDPEAAARMVGRADFKAAGLEAQSRALTVLENRLGPAPLAGKRVYLRGRRPGRPGAGPDGGRRSGQGRGGAGSAQRAAPAAAPGALLRPLAVRGRPRLQGRRPGLRSLQGRRRQDPDGGRGLSRPPGHPDRPARPRGHAGRRLRGQRPGRTRRPVRQGQGRGPPALRAAVLDGGGGPPEGRPAARQRRPALSDLLPGRGQGGPLAAKAG